MLRKIVAGVDGRPGGADAAALAAALAGPETDVLLVGVYRDSLMPSRPRRIDPDGTVLIEHQHLATVAADRWRCADLAGT